FVTCRLTNGNTWKKLARADRSRAVCLSKIDVVLRSGRSGGRAGGFGGGEGFARGREHQYRARDPAQRARSDRRFLRPILWLLSRAPARNPPNAAKSRFWIHCRSGGLHRDQSARG